MASELTEPMVESTRAEVQVPVGRHGQAAGLRSTSGEAFAVQAGEHWALVIIEEPDVEYFLGRYPVRASAPTITPAASVLTIRNNALGTLETVDLGEFATPASSQAVSVVIDETVTDPRTVRYGANGTLAVGMWLPDGAAASQGSKILNRILAGVPDLWLPEDPQGTLNAVVAEVVAAARASGLDPISFRLLVAGGGADGALVVTSDESGAFTQHALRPGAHQATLGDAVVGLFASSGSPTADRNIRPR
jgi:hypothetical protein